MAEPVVSMALGILRDLLEEEVRFLLGVSREVKALQTQLEEMKCLLEDADKRKFESKTVSSWISKIRDLVYRAEDVIETYAFNIASRRRGGYLKQILRRFACALEEGSTTHQIGTEISQIKSELATVTKSMQDYGIRSIIHGESSTNPIDDENQKWKRMTSPLQSDDCFVGKDQEVKSLVSLVVEDEQQRIITIWGMGGIGKTTIVRKVYNHKNVKRSFESFAWVCITQKCRIRSVLEDVLKQLNPSVADQITTFSDNDLIQNLSQVQRNKRCIVVLDDLWELNHWNGLKHGFLIEGSSSKVMVTTRIKDVAEKGYIKEIGLLNDEDGWTLLKAKAFAKNNIISVFGEFPTSSFPKLKILALIGLPNLKEWKVEQGAMPLLSRVLISHCLKLVMLPVGFRFLNLLDVLAIKGMAEMGRRVSEEGEDYDKVSHVPSILIED